MRKASRRDVALILAGLPFLASSVTSAQALPALSDTAPGVTRAVSSAASAAAATTAPSVVAGPTWLDRVNRVRSWGGVAPATTTDQVQSYAQHFLAYWVATGDETGEKHPEWPTYDYGLSYVASLSWKRSSDTELMDGPSSINAWASNPYTVMGLTDANYGKLGFAGDDHHSVLLTPDMPQAALPRNTAWPTGPGVDLFTKSAPEPGASDPTAACGSAPAAGFGLPIVIQYAHGAYPATPPHVSKWSSQAHLYENGAEVPLCVVTPDDMATNAQVQHAAFLFPKRPLVGNAKYTGSFTSNLGTVPIDFSTAPSAAPTPKRTVRGDLDGDGRRDELAITKTGALHRLPGKADGTFAPAVTIPGDFAKMNWIGSPGDLNRDGFQDALFRDTTGNLKLYSGDGKGGFSSAKTIGSGWGQMDPTKLFPITNFTNGATSLAAVNTTNCKLYRYDFAADGTIKASAVIGTGWCGMKQVFSNGDNNGDSIADMVGITTSGDYLLYYGNGAGTATDGPHKVGHGWNFVKVTAPGDGDGNGYDDVLTLNAKGEINQYLTTKNGAWLTPKLALTGFNNTYSVME